jgi:hypothetical protein
MIIFENDADLIVRQVALVGLNRFLRSHPEISNHDEITALYTRVFCPRAAAKLYKKATSRGHTFERSEGAPRLSVKRRQAFVINAIAEAIQQASKRPPIKIRAG